MKCKTKPMDFLEKLSVNGKISFSTEQFIEETCLAPASASATLWRLRRNKLIASPITGFHLVLAPPDRSWGCLPPDHFIDYLMRFLNEPYYVALLSAAESHGAAHHRPQIFQVMVRTARKPIHCGRVRIKFYTRKDLDQMPTIKKEVKSGYLNVATPEVTAIDLFGYVKGAAGLDNVATVLMELTESINPKKLAEVASLSPIAWAQRLGFCLDFIKRESKAQHLYNYIAQKDPRFTPLDPSNAVKNSQRNNRWKIIVNQTIESDL